MAKLTLLEMVQDILSDMDSDAVNSIADTVEATQVAKIIHTTFWEIIDDSSTWPHLRKLVQLDSAVAAAPTHMRLPTAVRYINWIKYNRRPSGETRARYEDITYLDTGEFINLLNTRNTDNSNVQSVIDIGSGGVELLILNDTAPQYWTSFDDDYIVFDSYDSAVEDTLQNSKTQVLCVEEPAFSDYMDDDFIPDLPSQAFSYLLAESKSVAFNALKQSPNAKEEQRATRQKNRLASQKWRHSGGIIYPNYGRK